MATIAETLTAALQHHQAGRMEAAEAGYREVLVVDPQHADAWHLLGLLAHQAGQHTTAIERIGRAVAACPDQAAFHCNLGLALKDQGQPEKAAASFRKAIEIRPEFAEAHNNLGNAQRMLGQIDEAVENYTRALQIRPDYAQAHNNLGAALQQQGQPEAAVASFHRAIRIDPDYAEAYNNLGFALAEQKKPEQAEERFRRALQIDPQYADAHNNLGNALKDQGQLPEAEAAYRRTLEIAPDYVEAHSNLGSALMDQGRLDEAEEAYVQALRIRPNHASTRLNRSLAWLVGGDFRRGWREYEWRWKTPACRPRDFSQPLWDGSTLTGRTILLHAEQGFGDTLHFVRYAAMVRRHGGTVLLECQPPLLPILQGCEGVDRLIGRGDDLPDFDVHCPLMSLPHVFGTTLDDVPADVPYLVADEELVARWKTRLDGIDGFRVGIAWQGNRNHPGFQFRRIPLAGFAPLADVPGVRLVSLQKGEGVEQLDELGGQFEVARLGDDVDEASGAFMDTAAVMKNLNLVITSDTAVAHLAGALRVPVWLGIHVAQDWRWLLDRDDTPWYPTMRLFRQQRFGEWGEVFERIQAELRMLV